MTIKTTFTESEVGALMQAMLGDTARQMSWLNESGSFSDAIESTLFALGLEDFSSINTVAGARKLRAVARMEAWRMAMQNSAHEASFSTGNPGTGQTSRSEVYRQAKEQFEMAEKEVHRMYPELLANAAPDASREALVISVRHAADPYTETSE